MKVKYLTLLTVLLTAAGISYAEDLSVYHYSFIENSQTYIFADNVRVRKSPEINNANIIDQLDTGDRVTILSRSEKSMVIDGYKEGWYKIGCRKKGKDLSGYVWGGFFSIGYSVRGERLFLTGIKSFKADTGFTAECRLVEKGKILSSVIFEPHYLPDGNNEGVYGYAVSSGLKGGLGLSGIENVLRLNFIYEACGYPGGNIWIGYGGNRLYYIGKDTSVSEAGVFHAEQRFIFPEGNKTGKDTVILIDENSEFDEKTNDYKLTEKKETKFLWRNFKLEAVK